MEKDGFQILFGVVPDAKPNTPNNLVWKRNSLV